MSGENNNGKNLDGEQALEYILAKDRLVKELKNLSLFLAGEMGRNVKIEIDVNPKVQSVKMSVKEYL